MNIRDILGLVPVIPLLSIEDAAHAVPLARALTMGGLRVLEISLRTSAALAAVEAVRKAVPEAIVGVDTLTRPVDFAAAGRAGAQFGVTPGMTPELAAAARGARFPVLPGVMTPSEILTARQAGFEVLRFFPAQAAGGVAMLQALSASFPELLFCPAGGITQAESSSYLALPNVLCVGGSWLAPTDVRARADWAGVEALARDAATLRSRAV